MKQAEKETLGGKGSTEIMEKSIVQEGKVDNWDEGESVQGNQQEEETVQNIKKDVVMKEKQGDNVDKKVNNKHLSVLMTKIHKLNDGEDPSDVQLEFIYYVEMTVVRWIDRKNIAEVMSIKEEKKVIQITKWNE